jgi:hypothetical protein
MKRLPLAILAGAIVVGSLATAVQAAPVTLSLSQLDEVTAGSEERPGGRTVLISTSTSAFSRSEVEGEGTASASAQASASVRTEAAVSGSLESND